MSPAVGQAARRRALATLVGAGGVVLWASETALVTFAGDVPPLQIVALAFGAVAALSPLLWRVQGLKAGVVLRQPVGAWVLNVVALLVFHASLYYAVQNAPPAGAALMQGFTPLAIVVGAALLPGERVRWWHLGGTLAGLIGMLALIAHGGAGPAAGRGAAAPYLAVSAAAAAAWALYSILNRVYSDVPSAAMGGFYGLTALLATFGHLLFETWVTPSPTQWAAIVALGVLPMGLALYCWDHGVKHGDLQALAAWSYSEALLATVLVVVLGRDAPSWTLLWSGILIIGGALLAARGLWHPVPAAAGDAAGGPLRDFQRVIARHAGELDAAVAAALDRSRAGVAECRASLGAHWPALLQAPTGVVDHRRLDRLLELQDESDLRRAYRAVADHLFRLALRRYRWQRHRLASVLAEISARLTDDLLFLRSRSRAARALWSRPEPGALRGHALGRLQVEVAAFVAAHHALERQTDAVGASAERLGALAEELAGQLARTAAAPGASAGPAGPADLDRGAAEIVRLLQAVARAGDGLNRVAAEEGRRIQASGARFSVLAGEISDLRHQTAEALDAALLRARPPLSRRASHAARARGPTAARASAARL